MSGPRARQHARPGMVAFGTVMFMITSVVSAAEDAPFNPGDLGQAIIAIAIFLLLLLVLGKYAWKPIITQLQSREDRIGQSVSLAQKQQKQAADLLSQYEAKISGAQEEADQFLLRAREQAEEHRQDLIAQGRTEADRSVKQAKREIQLARDAALTELRETTATLAVELAQRVLRREVTPDDQERLLHETLADIRTHRAEDA